MGDAVNRRRGERRRRGVMKLAGMDNLGAAGLLDICEFYCTFETVLRLQNYQERDFKPQPRRIRRGG